MVRGDRTIRIMLVAGAVLMASAEQADAKEVEDPVVVEECAASIRASPSFLWRGASGRGYEEDAPSMWQDGAIRVEISSGTCVFALVVDASAASLSGPSGSIGAVLSDAPGGLDLARLSSDPSSSPFSGGGRAGDIEEFAVYLTLPPGQSARAGDYAGGVPVRLFVIEEGIPVQTDEALIDMSASIGARLSVSAPGFSAGTADVDLGDISGGFRRSFEFDVAGNAPVSVSVSSMNAGALRHEKADIRIPYRTFLEDGPVDLRAGSSVSRYDLLPSREETLTLDVIGDPVEKSVAGTYRDTLTITFRSEG